MMWCVLPFTILAWLFICAGFCCGILEANKVTPEVRSDAFLGGRGAQNLHTLDAFSKRLSLPPGHWSQWSGDQIRDAANRLFNYFDNDESGNLDVDEMVKV